MDNWNHWLMASHLLLDPALSLDLTHAPIELKAMAATLVQILFK
jgi:hypothetical protein